MLSENIIKHKVLDIKNRILDLENQLQEFHSLINDKVLLAAKIHIKKEKELYEAKGNHAGYGWPTIDNTQYDWNFDKSGDIVVSWNEYWSYGGEDHGMFYITLDFVLNEKSQEYYVSEMDKKIELVKIENIKKHKEYKLAQLNKLKKELEND